MAGLIFWKKDLLFDLEKINNRFASLGYMPGKLIQLGEWRAVVFPKTVHYIQNWLIYSNGAICGIGTFAYKGKFYEQALPLIADDLRSKKLDVTGFWGCFLILAYIGGSLVLIRDGAGISRLYGLRDRNVYSTSFAGLFLEASSKYHFDHEAATELLVTGVLSGSQTIVKEIRSIDVSEKIEKFELIKSSPTSIEKPKIRREALNQQIALAQGFFKKIGQDWFAYMPKGVLDIGITGGMDSRLAVALSIGIPGSTVLHTHWRKEGMQNEDFRLAHIFAKSTGITLNLRQVMDPWDMSREQLERNYEKAFCLSDGLIRPGCYWDEEYSTPDYRLGLITPPYLRILGFGGEQYRNGDRLSANSNRNLKSWIRWEMIYRFAGNCIASKNAARKLEETIARNIIERMGKVNLNLSNYKKYVRTIWVPSYRSLQTNMENRLGFCISPFQDTCLSIPAQLAVPFLGKSLDFQLDMISRISPEIGSLPNDYGFNFTEGEPLRLKLGAIFWQLLPPGLKYPLHNALHQFHRTYYIPELENKHQFIKELEEIVLGLDLPINFPKYRLLRSRSKLMLNLGYFLKRNERFIHW